jgi:hypothetical protein
MSYVTKEQFEFLNLNRQGWQQKSFENLRHSINSNENIYTHSKTNDKDKLIFIAFMHNDGIGSGRILLSDELTRAFPNGYSVALPDRSCGLVIPNNISDKELAATKKMIKIMYKDAATPMSEQLHSSNDFNLPAEWTVPIDKTYSRLLTTEIQKLDNC